MMEKHADLADDVSGSPSLSHFFVKGSQTTGESVGCDNAAYFENRYSMYALNLILKRMGCKPQNALAIATYVLNEVARVCDLSGNQSESPTDESCTIYLIEPFFFFDIPT
jgi:hypothetical protein